MAKTKKNELATTPEETPSWLKPVGENEVVEGMENMRPGDLLVPRLVLMQGLSPQVVEGEKVAGEVLNSLTAELILEKNAIKEFVPVYHYLEWIKWDDRETGGGIQARSLDPEGELAQMAMRQVKRTNSKGNEVLVVTEYHNFIVLFPDDKQPIPHVISCAKTNIKKGKKLLGLARFRGRYPLFAGKYTVQAILERNSKNQTYYVFEFTNAGWASKENYKEYEKLYTTLKEAYQQRRLVSDQEVEHPIESNEEEM